MVEYSVPLMTATVSSLVVSRAASIVHRLLNVRIQSPLSNVERYPIVDGLPADIPLHALIDGGTVARLCDMRIRRRIQHGESHVLVIHIAFNLLHEALGQRKERNRPLTFAGNLLPVHCTVQKVSACAIPVDVIGGGLDALHILRIIVIPDLEYRFHLPTPLNYDRRFACCTGYAVDLSDGCFTNRLVSKPDIRPVFFNGPDNGCGLIVEHLNQSAGLFLRGF